MMLSIVSDVREIELLKRRLAVVIVLNGTLTAILAPMLHRGWVKASYVNNKFFTKESLRHLWRNSSMNCKFKFFPV